MLSESTRKRIKAQKMGKHSNPSQFATRVKNLSLSALDDLALIAEKLDEEQLKEIFTPEKLRPLILALLKPRNLRTLKVAELFAGRIYQKLINDLHPDIANQFSSDIGKSWFMIQMAVAYWDKPFSEKNVSIQS